ncbi:MAG: DNA repair protein RadA [Candidatus Chisholmbacteria bacterium]|nr:DNA repair protein RadA [Candidatus Chisholmbacteria bacterium]
MACKLRVDRLAAATKAGSRGEKTRPVAANLLLLPETDVDAIVETIEQLAHNRQQTTLGLVIVDSIQTMSTGDLTGMAWSVGQIRESAFRLINISKKTGVPLFIVGHVTKEGSIAGPKVLEHMVDVVLELTGETTHEFRILRGLKNRFGAIDEVGVFTLGDSGMEGVANPSDVFLGRRKAVPGSAVVVTMAGLRPVLTEVQALVTPTTLAVPRRVSTGIDQRRVVLLAAVLTRHCGLRLNQSDIFVRVSGGLTLAEPAADLAVALAIASAALGKHLSANAVAVGEVGLLGEIRPVGRMKQRISEATKQGYSQIISAERFETLALAVRRLLR